MTKTFYQYNRYRISIEIRTLPCGRDGIRVDLMEQKQGIDWGEEPPIVYNYWEGVGSIYGLSESPAEIRRAVTQMIDSEDLDIDPDIVRGLLRKAA